MPGRKWSFFENGMPGLHLTINPLKPLPPEVHVVRQYLDQGIVLNDQERASILSGRDEGVGTVKNHIGSDDTGLRAGHAAKIRGAHCRCFA
jgi:hypothetical protein